MFLPHTFTVYLPEGYKNYDGSSVIKILLDDKLVYTSPKIKAGELPVDIDVDINGAYKMEIVCTGNLQAGSNHCKRI